MALTKAQEEQAKKNRKYWADREGEALKHRITDEKEYDRQLKRIYQSMLDSVQKEIDSFYGRYASKEGITIAEAKKRVSKADIAAYERKAKRYVRDKDFSAKANEEMRLYNLTMKVNRLEMLKANIGLELIAGHGELEKFMEGVLQDRTMDELERQAGILGKTVRNNAQKAHSIVNASFHNATFSDRIWMYQDLLRADLNKLLQTGLIQGKNPRVLAREIKAKFGASTYNAERLMRTELARVQTDAQKQSFIRNGFGKYIFIVNGGCCDICKEVSKKNDGVYYVEKMQPGENAPPMHPHCRCSTAAWEDDDEYNAWLDHLANGGTTEEWNKRKKKGSTTDEEPKDYNASGRRQVWNDWEEYRKKFLGHAVPLEDGEIDDKWHDTVKLPTAKPQLCNDMLEALRNVGAKYYSPLQTVIPMGKTEVAFSNAFATTSHRWETGSCEIRYNPLKFSDKGIQRLRELSENGYMPKINAGDEIKYIVTHEYGHAIINIDEKLPGKSRNFTQTNFEPYKKARKELTALYDDYAKNVEATKERYEAFSKPLDTRLIFEGIAPTADEMATVAKLRQEYEDSVISRYSLTNVEEFVAEGFADAELGTNPNAYSLKVRDVIAKYFGKG